jgi:hypothetical protein
MMNRILAPYLGKFCVVYLEDVLIYSKTADEHLEHIRLVLREMQRHQLHIKLSKCYFLGMWWKLDRSEWTPIKWRQYKIGRPKYVTEVRGFVGLAGYYRRFINQFATLATPLKDLTKKTPEFR